MIVFARPISRWFCLYSCHPLVVDYVLCLVTDSVLLMYCADIVRANAGTPRLPIVLPPAGHHALSHQNTAVTSARGRFRLEAVVWFPVGHEHITGSSHWLSEGRQGALQRQVREQKL